MRVNWFIATLVTLVTHSSGVSRGIHHKCEHPLNPTKLYVFGWVESSRSVLIESHNMLGWCMDIEWRNYIFDCMIKMLLALAYPVCCMVVLYMAIVSCDDHQFNWWEQMGEVPAVSKEMAILLPSHLGWICLHVFFRAKAYVSFHVSLLYTLC